MEAPVVPLSEGLQTAIQATDVEWLPRPAYRFDAEENTRIRNGHAIRSYSLDLAHLVQARLSDGEFPVVIDEDCSVLLGCIARAGALDRVGLLHIDCHSDYFHPGNYDVQSRLGTVAGMDLALATGRGGETSHRMAGYRRKSRSGRGRDADGRA